jgi:D-beta-D-heptose 7-phosphate kinase/D-beta-D-heptose 1-phosphate adenosyltransferase
MYERLIEILKATGNPKVLLVGDFMLDNYVYGDINRISPEAPVMVLNVTERQEQPGGAGSVAMDLAILECEVACLGVVGRDDNGGRLCSLLAQTGRINVAGLVATDDRPTTLKQRIIGLAQHRHRQQLMRIDDESSDPVVPATRQLLSRQLDELLNWCDVVCLQDYNKGVLSNEFCQEIIAAAGNRQKQVIIDPASIKDYSRYEGGWLIKPNRRELALAAEMKIDGPETWFQAAQQLARKYNIENIAVTLDKQGAYLYNRGSDAGELIGTRPRNVYDVTGAGDMVLAMMGLLMGARYEGIEAPKVSEVVRLANVAGGLEVERFGCVGINRKEIMAELARERHIGTGKLRSLDSLIADLQWHRQQKSKIVLTNGCFDILHPGHINLLSFAKKQGDILIVAINSDSSVRTLKGPSRPILKEHDRAALLSALEAVDYVVIFSELDPEEIIKKVSPDVLVKGADWTGNVVGQALVEGRGGKVVLMPLVKGNSTTSIIDQVIEKTYRQTKERR